MRPVHRLQSADSKVPCAVEASTAAMEIVLCVILSLTTHGAHTPTHAHRSLCTPWKAPCPKSLNRPHIRITHETTCVRCHCTDDAWKSITDVSAPRPVHRLQRREWKVPLTVETCTRAMQIMLSVVFALTPHGTDAPSYLRRALCTPCKAAFRKYLKRPDMRRRHGHMVIAVIALPTHADAPPM